MVALLVMGVVPACSCGLGPEEGVPEEDGGGSTIQFPDAGRDGGSDPADDAGTAPGEISVSCTGPGAAIKANTPVDVVCTIDAAGRSLVNQPTLRAEPSQGVVMQPGYELGRFTFSINTRGYAHPLHFEDTRYRVTFEVHDSASTAFGRATIEVTVLGNYWVGDGSSSGQGIYAFASDGTPLGQVVGPAGITGVYDLKQLPSGDIAVTSASAKQIKVFNRQGLPVSVPFADTDPFTGLKFWEDDGYTQPAPYQMAVSSRGELWIAGAMENKVWGVVVLNPVTGAFVKFLTPSDTTNQFRFTAIGRRSDGKMLVSSNERRTIHIFDELTYAHEGQFSIDTPFCYIGSLVPLENAQMLAAGAGSGCGVVRLSPTLGVLEPRSEEFDSVMFEGAIVSGDEILMVDSNSWGDNIVRIDLATMQAKTPFWDLGKSARLRGIVRLTPPQ